MNYICLDKENFDEILKKENVVVDFYASWCGPCKMFAPIFEEVSKENNFNIFESVDNSDTYVTYHVYIVKEEDTIESIMKKYNVDKEQISLYNTIEEIKPGTKLIIPNSNE